MYSRILCPIDGSATSERGLDEAIRLARDQKAQLRLLYVIDAHLAAMDPYGTVNLADLIDASRNYGKELLEHSSARARAEGVRVEVGMLDTLAGPVGEMIAADAREWRAELIVMGTHGRRGVRRVVMGSDAELVVRTSPAPVLLVRAPEGEATR
jgi:nucleotide-binding universal stress UspA family protein